MRDSPGLCLGIEPERTAAPDDDELHSTRAKTRAFANYVQMWATSQERLGCILNGATRMFESQRVIYVHHDDRSQM